jgi:hypothetical protein
MEDPSCLYRIPRNQRVTFGQKLFFPLSGEENALPLSLSKTLNGSGRAIPAASHYWWSL